MKKSLLIMALLAVVFVAGGKSQRLSDIDKPMWTMEFIQVRPGMYGATLGYLDDNWMRVREEAKHRGAVVTYQRLVQQMTEGEPKIILITEFKNSDAYLFRDSLFDSISKNLPTTPGVVRLPRESLFDAGKTMVLQDCPASSYPEQKLLSKN
jgi:hypothetical protein